MLKADRLCSQYWREKIGKCERCGSWETEKLQMAHIHTRNIRGIRFDRRNLLVLCASCHSWGHAYPTLFGEFVKSNKKPEDYKFLIQYKPSSGIATTFFYEKIIQEYTKKISLLNK